RGAHAVAYMASKEVNFESAEMFTMFRTQARAYHLTSYTDWNQFGERTMQRGYDCSMRLFSKDNRPDALICADDAVAFGAMVALHTLGLRVPEDVRIVGFDDSPLAATSMPTLTSVRPPFEQIVSESLRLLAAGTGQPSHVSLPPQLVIRESTRYGRP
ncbi:substrate-binding domain-containing protein, partial [Bifidobacterium sp. 64T4]|uniref:LacI family DNA-binding transcriptional regulator n=1 Tax=Bifidobacterium pongonis TaxID=2834432 RepID=UPI001C5635F0